MLGMMQSYESYAIHPRPFKLQEIIKERTGTAKDPEVIGLTLSVRHQAIHRGWM